MLTANTCALFCCSDSFSVQGKHGSLRNESLDHSLFKLEHLRGLTLVHLSVQHSLVAPLPLPPSQPLRPLLASELRHCGLDRTIRWLEAGNGDGNQHRLSSPTLPKGVPPFAEPKKCWSVRFYNINYNGTKTTTNNWKTWTAMDAAFCDDNLQRDGSSPLLVAPLRKLPQAAKLYRSQQRY